MDPLKPPVGPWLPRSHEFGLCGRSRILLGALAVSLLIHVALFAATALAPEHLRTPPEISVGESTPVEVVVEAAGAEVKSAAGGLSLPLEALAPAAQEMPAAPAPAAPEATATDPTAPVKPVIEAEAPAAPPAPHAPVPEAEAAPAADEPAAPSPTLTTALPPPMAEQPALSPAASVEPAVSVDTTISMAAAFSMKSPGDEPVPAFALAPSPTSASAPEVANTETASAAESASVAEPTGERLAPAIAPDAPAAIASVEPSATVSEPSSAIADTAPASRSAERPAETPPASTDLPAETPRAAAAEEPPPVAAAAASAARADPPAERASAPTVLALAAPPQALAPSDPRQAVERAIGALDCARVSASVDLLAGRAVLSGHVRSAEDRARLAGKIAAMPGVRTVEAGGLSLVGEPYCRVLSLLGRPEFQKSTEQRGDLLTVGATNASASRRAVGGETLALTLSAPEFDAYLYVDHFSADGRVLHLLPTDRPDNRFKADAVFRLGSASPLGRKAVIGPPYGLDVVLVLGSSEPIFVRPRAASEDAAQYLAALDERLQLLRSGGYKPRIEYAYYLVTTSPPPGGGH